MKEAIAKLRDTEKEIEKELGPLSELVKILDETLSAVKLARELLEEMPDVVQVIVKEHVRAILLKKDKNQVKLPLEPLEPTEKEAEVESGSGELDGERAPVKVGFRYLSAYYYLRTGIISKLRYNVPIGEFKAPEVYHIIRDMLPHLKESSIPLRTDAYLAYMCKEKIIKRVTLDVYFGR